MSRIRTEGLVLGPQGGQIEDGPSDSPSPEELEALRLRAATALEQGLGFVDRHGGELARLRVRGVLGAEPLDECTRRISEAQNPDGSFPPLGLGEAGAPGLTEAHAGQLDSHCLGTLEALIALSDLGMHHHPCVEGAAVFMHSIQLEDGSWGNPEVVGENRIFATGMVAGLLGRTRVVRPEVLDAAGEFLAGLFTPERISGRNWEALTAFGVFFTNVGHDEADTALQWIGRELERGFRMRIYEAGLTLRTLLHCQTLVIPGAGLAPFDLLTDLLSEQGADGGFAELTAGSDLTRVEPTLDAILGTLRLCDSL